MRTGAHLRSIFIGAIAAASLAVGCKDGNPSQSMGMSQHTGDGGTELEPVLAEAVKSIERGREIFRFDTFGSEDFWGDGLKLHRAIAGEANGGVGMGLSPMAALGLGLKVDAEKIPAELASQIQMGKVDLGSPATTLALLELDAVIGVKGIFGGDKALRSVGIQCSLCHTAVDDSFAPGIGRRLDGWANSDLNVGAIIALAPDLTPFTTLLGADDPTVRKVLMSWGPGKFDAALILDGKTMRPDAKSAAILIPPVFGLAGISLHTRTGWGGISHWNAFVAVLAMGGKGTFFDPRLDDMNRFPIAAREKLGHVRRTPDLVSSKLADLLMYQLALQPPPAPNGSFDMAAAGRGGNLFNGRARCAECHTPPLYVEPGWPMHRPNEIGVDDFQARRSPDGRYRTAPLRGLHSHLERGLYHDGRFPTLLDVVNHYDSFLRLNLSPTDKTDLVEFLKSL
jgi:hypothetical protein